MRFHALLTYVTSTAASIGCDDELETLKDDICPLVEHRQMYRVDTHYNEVTEHPIVQEWRARFLAMSTDLSNLFAESGDGLIHRMGLNTANGIEKWGAACTMGHSAEFIDEVTDSHSKNIMLYVRKRVSYVLVCLNTIKGPPIKYVKYIYI